MSTESSGWNPWNWWRMFVPQNLTQPILPGWTVASPALTINSVNSSAPQTEAEVVQRHSYGRQLGRMADALEVLILERGKSAASDERLKDFMAMKEDIDEVKFEAAMSRVDQLRHDLATLKATRPPEHQSLHEALSRLVKNDTSAGGR